jgi:hypothetical protein
MVKSQNGERTDVVQYLMYEADYGNPDAQVAKNFSHSSYTTVALM